MGFMDFLEKKTNDFNGRVSDKCDEFDRKLDRYERKHPEDSSRIAELREKNSSLRNKHS
ncbi:MAG: hypothetical protein ACI4J6_13070 [Oscillospiraceae bacterium]